MTSPPDQQVSPIADGVAERAVEVTVSTIGAWSGYAVADDLILTAPLGRDGALLRPQHRADWFEAELAGTHGDLALLRTAGPYWAGVPAEPAASDDLPELPMPCLVVGFRAAGRHGSGDRAQLEAIHGVLHPGRGSAGYTVEVSSGGGAGMLAGGLRGAPILSEDGTTLLGMVVAVSLDTPDEQWLDVVPIRPADLDVRASREAPGGETEPAEPVPARVNDHVEWQSDAPTTRDLLRRDALARAIADRLRRRSAGDPATFLMLLDGRWGSGKTSVLRMTQRHLAASGWTIVHYDAWRQSRIGASWWTLLSEVRHAVFGATKSRARRMLLRLRELWRQRLMRTPAVLALCLVFGAALGLFLLLRPERFDLSSLGTALQSVAAVVTAVGTLWAGAVVSARFLLWQSRRSARFFEETAENPLRQVAEHLGWLIHRLSRPMLVAIDDIDRCPGEQVVELLESVQTLLRDAPAPGRGAPQHPVAVVVAADAAWLHQAFEQHYDGFGVAVATPGKPLGYLFCDKIFQLVVPMPGMGEVGQTAFLASLLGPHQDRASGTDPDGEQVRDAARLIESASSEAEVLEVLSSVEQPIREAVAGQAVTALTRPEVVEGTEHALTRYASLLPPNPRSMKRFVNDYSMARTVRTLEGDPVPVDALAQWTVVRTRWPALATYLAEHPEAAADRARPGSASGSDPADLLASPEIRRVLSFPAGVTLTPDLIRRCHGGQVTSFPAVDEVP